MADQIKYSNLTQSNVEEIGKFVPKLFGVNNQGPIDKVREEMREQYGWLSPYEYYYGSPDNEQSEVQRTTLMPVFTPQAIGLVGDRDLFSDVEAASKDDIPNWFWVDSFSNWCYIKSSAYLAKYENSTRTALGEFLHGLVGADMITGNLFGAIVTEFILQAAEGHLDEWYSSVPTAIVTDWVDASDATIGKGFEYTGRFINAVSEKVLTTVDQITGGLQSTVTGAISSLMGASSWLLENAYIVTFGGLISTIIRTFFNAKTADSEAENLIEYTITRNGAFNLSRNCLSTYMWNGYTRSWMPLKWMIKVYDRYMKRENRNLFKQLFGVDDTSLSKNITKLSKYREEYLNTIVPKEIKDNDTLLNLDETGNIRSLVTEYRNAWNTWDSNHNNDILVSTIEDVIRRSYNSVNDLTRSVFMQVFLFDPACFEVFTTRSPLNKLQTIATAASSQGHLIGGGLPNCRWLENWGMWVPLPSDRAKIKLYSDNTFQLINRPYYDFRNDYLITRGNIHTNIGHPCFMRGNDDVLWMCYWLRWTSSPKVSTDDGWFSDSISSKGVPDISDKDIENWDAIINSMFQKHDEYGFEDWMINGNYCLSYSKFTIDEESPTAISSYEESELNPLKSPIVNSIDRINKNRLVMRLSDSTVVNREDKNGMSHVAKRWV